MHTKSLVTSIHMHTKSLVTSTHENIQPNERKKSNQLHIIISFFAVLSIGFINEPYQNLESNGFVTLTVGVIAGSPGKTIVVSLTTEDIIGEAIGK